MNIKNVRDQRWNRWQRILREARMSVPAGGSYPAVYPVKRVRTHCDGHDDEFCAMWQARNLKEGQAAFPGILDADVEFLREEPTYREIGDLDIGIGQGPFDEHRPTGRLKDTCAAKLMAERLGVLDGRYPALKLLVDEVQRIDSRGGAQPSQLANIIKAFHRVNGPEKQLDAYKFAAVAYNGLVFGRFDRELDIRERWESYRLARKLSWKYDPAIAVVRGLINNSFARRGKFATEIASIAPYVEREIRDSWLDDLFRVLIEDARLYQFALEEVTTSSSSIDVETSREIEPAAFFASDNPLINRAVFSDAGGKPGVCVIKRSTGHMQVFANPEKGMEISVFSAFVRMAEYKAWTGRLLPFEDAYGIGTKPLCPIWHQPHGSQLFNASLSHPEGIEPSLLTLKDMEHIAAHAFKDELAHRWLDEYYGSGTGDENPFVTIDLGSVMDQALQGQ